MIEQVQKSDPDLKVKGMELARIYAEVFAGPPWSEYTRCSANGRFFGLNTVPGKSCATTECSPCTGILDLVYPEVETANYIEGELSKTNAAAKIITEEGQILAFAWGFSLESPEAFAEEKYKTVKMQDNIIRLLRECGISNRFFYFSEFGIAEMCRGRGWSNDLFTELSKEAQKLQLNILMRTNQESPMIAVAEKFGMTQILGPIVKPDRLAKRFLVSDQAVNGCLDQENNSRVLFILPKK